MRTGEKQHNVLIIHQKDVEEELLQKRSKWSRKL